MAKKKQRTALGKIVPFYSAIDELVNIMGKDMEERIKRKTLRTETELKILLQTEVERKISEIREQEKEGDYIRQTAFEKHRVDLFERVKRLEVDISEQILAFDLEKQKELREWQRSFMESLENESERVMIERVPRMLAQAELFKENEIVYNKWIERIFKIADKLTESIAFDQEHFRDSLKELASRPGRLTDSLIEMNKNLIINSPTRKMIEGDRTSE